MLIQRRKRMAKKRIVNIFSEAEPLWKYLKGTGQWITVVDADDYDKWSVNLYGDEVLDLRTELQAFLDEAVAFAESEGKEVKNIAGLYKEYQGKEYIQFKKPKYDDDTEPPKLYNITGEEITGKMKKPIGGGSTVRIRAMIKPYYMASTKSVGLTYRLLALQIIENKEYAGASGFEDESGGSKAPFEVEESEDY